ncbi:transport ATP-binding protein [Prescottella equi]|uniref:ABC transporter ATP-binding protein n=1 Tax=Rhodococcus hoagii TaxID=43767 RepID=UPI0007CD7085|nr:ABC transporter ATP-binding protein [Prescottella equi]ORL32475.1 transport ATP-binding protein [Prescottella equi]ORL91155.1 transport ATP-binding protein [Prescottella equi]ORM23044.1 transport ATP-binding protein [Prescottella equi]
MGAVGTPLVSVENLTRRFGPRRGVTDVSFRIDEGEVFGFLGPNGAGKSTTIRILLGLYGPTSGQVRVFGLDPTREASRILARVGYLPGELALYPQLTGGQLLDRFARMRGLSDLRYRDELVDRFGAELDRPARTLSKGNRQKIGLVMAFMHRPDLLVLDEPTSGLDPLMQDEFAGLVRETIGDGRTILLSSHDLDEVQQLVERVCILREGRAVVTASVESLRRSSPRAVELRFDHDVRPDVFARLDGVTVRSSDGDRITLSVTGPVTSLLRAAADAGAVDIVARRADLEELFLSYYRGESGPVVPDGD